MNLYLKFEYFQNFRHFLEKLYVLINAYKILFPIVFNSFLNAGSAAIFPGAVAIKFVALAETGDNPASIKAGNVKKVAPPATAFKMPENDI